VCGREVQENSMFTTESQPIFGNTHRWIFSAFSQGLCLLPCKSKWIGDTGLELPLLTRYAWKPDRRSQSLLLSKITKIRWMQTLKTSSFAGSAFRTSGIPRLVLHYFCIYRSVTHRCDIKKHKAKPSLSRISMQEGKTPRLVQAVAKVLKRSAAETEWRVEQLFAFPPQALLILSLFPYTCRHALQLHRPQLHRRLAHCKPHTSGLCACWISVCLAYCATQLFFLP
jgi:hypothetical protein